MGIVLTVHQLTSENDKADTESIEAISNDQIHVFRSSSNDSTSEGDLLCQRFREGASN